MKCIMFQNKLTDGSTLFISCTVVPSLWTVYSIWVAAATSFLYMTSFYRLWMLCTYWLQHYPVKNTEVGKGHLCSLCITCLTYLLPLLHLRFCGFWDCHPHILLYFGNIFLYLCTFFLQVLKPEELIFENHFQTLANKSVITTTFSTCQG